MRGNYKGQATMLCIVSPDQRVPKEHPLRRIKIMTDKELNNLSPVFEKMYSTTGRPSIPPERILKSMLLIALY